MTCPSCQRENFPGAKFCLQCGNALGVTCASCHAAMPVDAQFCSACGKPMIAGQPPVEVGQRERAEEGERRHLSVMFCDLVDSMRLGERLDPEDLHTVLRSYQDACARVIEQYDGFVARYLGDGLLVYYGYPHAHEDDAARAVRAGLGILEELDRLNVRLKAERNFELTVRIGIHCGPVVVAQSGDDAADALVTGHTLNVAARLQGIAEPDSVVISDDTLHLIEGLFVTQELGVRSLKGMAEPLVVHRVMRASGARSRLDLAEAAGLTPLVGRQQDLGLLLDRWEQAREGAGQLVLVSGEAGIGKSRLARALRTELAGQAHAWIECRGSVYHTQSALYPVIDLLQQGLRFGATDSSEQKIAKLARGLEAAGFAPGDSLPLFANLLSLPPPEGSTAPALQPNVLRRRTLAALCQWVFRLARLQPTVLVVEDLHWIDPSTLDFLGLLGEQMASERLLLLLTSRPSFQPPWPRHPHTSHLPLDPLSRELTRKMIAGMLGGRTLPADLLERLVAKTDGVPIFIEELVKMVLESDILREGTKGYELAAPLGSLAIPATLQASLTARLDRLADVKGTAQLGATLGREFSRQLLAAVSPLSEKDLDDALAQLVAAGLLQEQPRGASAKQPSGKAPEATYAFRHALIQDAAYQSLLKRRRRQVHRQIATTLRDRYPEIAETQPEVLAHHFEEAGLVSDAIDYRRTAGQRAAARSSHVEAVSHLSRALDLLLTRPEKPERDRQELLLRLSVGVELIATKGYASPDVERTVIRARELCDRMGAGPQLFPVLRGLCSFYATRADFPTTRGLAEQLLQLAERAGETDLLIEAYEILGVTLCFMGEFARAREFLEKCNALYDPDRHRYLAVLYGHDAGVACRSYLAWSLWFLGYPDRAMEMNRSSLEHARGLDHPFSAAFALACSACLHAFRGDDDRMSRDADAALALADEHGFPFWQAIATTLQGWAKVRGGRVQEGIEHTRRGLGIFDATGTAMGRSYYLALLADVHCRVGKAEESRRLIAEGLERAERGGERFWQAELYRVKGDECLARSPADPAEAEFCYRRALDIARTQQAKLLELRAAMSLGQLLREGDVAVEARGLLADAYTWFSEGFDTTDLQRAKASLAGLGESPRG